MKVCIKCNTEKPLSEFYRNKDAKDGHQSRCKECASNYGKQHFSNNKQYYVAAAKVSRENLKQWFKDFKSACKCEICGESESVCLDFHHRDPTKKEFLLSTMAKNSLGKQKIIDEVAKCAVLCSNCHRKLHAGLIFLGP